MLDYDIKSMYEDMELQLIKSMKRNYKRHLEEEDKTGFEFPQWQALKLKELKRYQRQNKAIVSDEVKGFNSEISQHLKVEFKEGSKRALKQYKDKMGSAYKANKQLNNSFFKINDKKVDALIKTVNSDLSEGNKAVLRMANDQYRQVIHKSAMYMANGVYTPAQAIDMANKEFLQRGLNVIEYKDGRRVNIASYSEMAVRTASLRATLMGEGEFRKAYKQPLVRVTTHGTACPLCQDWQGKVLIDDVYGGGTKEDGNYPLLSYAMDEGFLHPNCKHGLTSYFPEIEDIVESYKDGKDGSESDAQYQADLNYINLKIKEYTRLETGSLDKENIKKYRTKKKEWKNKKEKLEINNNRKIYNVFLEDDEINELYNSVDDLSDIEREALKSYTGFSYGRINEALRNNFKKVNINVKSLNEIKEDIKNISNAINRHTIGQDALVFRKMEELPEILLEGFSGQARDILYDWYKYPKEMLNEVLKGLEGTTFTEKGFMSTTIDLKSAVEFKGNKGYLLEIEADKDTNAIYLEKISQHSSEKELLFDKGCKLKIMKAEYMDDYGFKGVRISARIIKK